MAKAVVTNPVIDSSIPLIAFFNDPSINDDNTCWVTNPIGLANADPINIGNIFSIPNTDPKEVLSNLSLTRLA